MSSLRTYISEWKRIQVVFTIGEGERELSPHPAVSIARSLSRAYVSGRINFFIIILIILHFFAFLFSSWAFVCVFVAFVFSFALCIPIFTWECFVYVFSVMNWHNGISFSPPPLLVVLPLCIEQQIVRLSLSLKPLTWMYSTFAFAFIASPVSL